jgi:hypothetical protein
MGRVTLVMQAFVLGACGTANGGSDGSGARSLADVEGILPSAQGAAVDEGVNRARAATAAFADIDRAVEAGYPGRVTQCLDNPPEGAMGHHHQNPALLDTILDIERPEILVYGRAPDGAYTLNGVEYVVPMSEWKGSEPPEILGQQLKRAPALGIWYLHVWIWEPNPSGLFADWNPSVTC